MYFCQTTTHSSRLYCRPPPTMCCRMRRGHRALLPRPNRISGVYGNWLSELSESKFDLKRLRRVTDFFCICRIALSVMFARVPDTSKKRGGCPVKKGGGAGRRYLFPEKCLVLKIFAVLISSNSGFKRFNQNVALHRRHQRKF